MSLLRGSVAPSGCKWAVGLGPAVGHFKLGLPSISPFLPSALPHPSFREGHAQERERPQAGTQEGLCAQTPNLCFEGNLLALFSSSSRRRRASSSCVRGLGAGLGGIVGS